MSSRRRDREKPIAVRPALRRGVIVVLSAVLMIVMMGFIALSVDVGYMFTMQSQLQRSVDAAALAGAGTLIEGEDVATAKVHEYLTHNPVGLQWKEFTDGDTAANVDLFLSKYGDGLELSLGQWNSSTQRVESVEEGPTTVSVRMTYQNMPFFFGHLLGRDSFDITAESIATYQNRDIMLVLDLSGSMNDDSEFKSIGRLGLEHIYTNSQQMYADLGYPVYGNLTFDPAYAKATGTAPISDGQARTSVTYRGPSAVVTSDKAISKVTVRTSGGSTYNYYPSGATSYTASPNQEIRYVWITSGKNADNSDQVHSFDFDGNRLATIRKALALDNVAYPYPQGSWNDYLNYCLGTGQNNDAGYRYKFGYMSWINYLLEKRYSSDATPDLWKASAHPITAVKNSVDLFIHFMQEGDGRDRVGLAVYNAPNGNGLLESTLTENLGFIMSQTRQRQAGHYHNYTNIGGGMTTGREELQARGREGSVKMMVLLTDGQANWVNGGVNSTAAKQYVIDEAYLCKDQGFKIITISLGAGADTALMDEVARITDGVHFNVPGGQSVAEYSEDLTEIFRQVAGARPLKLVK
ncbi:VWA domain-containing protein [Blastopirellula sp. JC732]|uniref:VWA domain-containing protein n=1 Tax=Blastopirellula sediminis TaxID=2894196 RepID=A0A9X1MNE9_9BACT|nr:pilus assembly protein TadG-related protein [Blastopirellula sediminis]MCC9607615.1 VWA domain-containing protein [Blastopirellula sediminis]MCC9629092.1 VWA domain-containing protein [Blastopirellula sediminis]